MKVSELIKELKKLPQNLEVYWADHDHGEFETNNIAGRVVNIDKSKMTKYSNDKSDESFQLTPQKYVLIRP